MTCTNRSSQQEAVCHKTVCQVQGFKSVLERL